MLIFLSVCIRRRLIISVLILQIIQVRPLFGVKTRRTKSMSVLNHNLEPVVKTRPTSISSSSSASSTSSIATRKNEAIASTSASQHEIDLHLHQHHKMDHKPLIEQSKHVRFAGSASSLTDPMAVTQREHLDPTRDGFFARLRNTLIRYGSVTAVGSVLGAGSLAAKQFLFQSNSTQVNSINTTATQNLNNTTLESNIGIPNPFRI